MTKLLIGALAGATALTLGTAAANPFGSIATGEYAIDKTHGYVTFSYSHLGYSRPILRFDDVDATVSLDGDDIGDSTLAVTIDPASVNSGVEKFDGHLKGADFFDVENHGDITFVSTGIDTGDGETGTLTGDLTIKGVTKPVTLDVTLNKAEKNPITGKDAFGISATTVVDRTEFGLDAYAPAVGAEVTISVEAEFIKAE